jgi:DNA-binding NarL/FixJ family response regulator
MLRILTIAGDLDALAAIARQSLDTSGSWNDLSPREQEVLRLVADGHSNREIGRMLFIAEATVKVHVCHILEKLDVRSRTAAALRVPAHARSKQHLVRRPESADHP